jgi:CRP-like cAMP-binding protein
VRIVKVESYLLDVKSSMEKDGHSVNQAAYRIVRLLVFAGLYASFMACLWFHLACTKSGSIDTDGDWSEHITVCSSSVLESWISNDTVIIPGDTASAYIRSLHFIMQTLFTIGFGDIWPVSSEEYFFALIMIVIASLFYAVLISSITSLLANREVTTKKFRGDLDTLKRYLLLRGCPKALQDRIRECQEFLFSRQCGLQEHFFLKKVPHKLVLDIKEQCGGNQLRAVPFFSRQSERFVTHCVERLTFRCYAPGNYLYRQDEPIRELILIRSGRVDILIGNGSRSLFTLVTGDHTGDFQMLFGTSAEVSAKASGYCETMVLSWDAFSEALRLSGMGVGLMDGLLWGHGVLKLREPPLVEQQQAGPASLSDTQQQPQPPQITGNLSHLQQQQQQQQQQALALVKYVENGREKGGHVAPPSPMPPLGQQSRQSIYGGVKDSSRHKGASAIHRFSTYAHASVQTLAVEELRSEIERSGRPATWVDFHKGALQSTTDAHREFLMKLVRAQTSMERANEKKGRHKRMFDMMLTDSQPAAKSMGWEDRLVLQPEKSARLVWECVALAGMLYYTFAIPLSLMLQGACLYDEASLEGVAEASPRAYTACFSEWDWGLLVDYLFDLFFMVDVVMRARFFAFREFDEERDCEVTIEAPAAIWEVRGTQRYFYLSCALVAPWDLLAPVTGYVRLYRLAKLMYVFHVPSIIANIQLFLDKERNYSIASESMTVVHLAFATCTMIVWLVCIWSFLVKETQNSENWVASFYWCLTAITTVGYGDIHPKDLHQTSYVILVSMIGPALSATIIANVSSYMHSVDVSTDSVQHRRVVCRRWLSTIGCNRAVALTGGSAATPGDATGGGGGESDLVDLSDAYFEYLQRDCQGIHENKVLSDGMSPAFGEEVRLCFMESLLAGVPLLERLSKSMLREVVQAIEVRVYTKKSTMLDFTPPAQGLYIIKSGSVNVHDKRLRSVTQRMPGECIAEGCMLEEWTSNPYKVKVSSDCEVLFLSRMAFLAILRRDPTAHEYLPYMRAVSSTAGQIAKNLAKSSKDATKALVHLQETRESNRLFFHPTGTFMCRWSALVLLSVMYSAIFLPIRLSFLEGYTLQSPSASARSTATLFAVLDYGTDMLLVADIILRACFVAFMHHNDLVRVRWRIWENYRYHGRFWLNALAIFPFELLALVTGPWSAIGYDQAQTLVALRLNRMLRAVGVNETMTIVEKSLSQVCQDVLGAASTALRDLSARFKRSDKESGRFAVGIGSNNSSSSSSGGGGEGSGHANENAGSLGVQWRNIVGIAKLIAVIIFTAHCAGCLFFIIANSLHLRGYEHNWAANQGLLRDCSFGILSASAAMGGSDGCTEVASWSEIADQYMHSLYWATCVMFTVGYGDIVPVAQVERIYNILLFLVGTCVFAMVIVYVNDIVCQLDVTSDIFKGRLLRVKALLKRLDLGQDTWLRVQAHYQREWAGQRGGTGDELRDFLPSHIYGGAVMRMLSGASDGDNGSSPSPAATTFGAAAAESSSMLDRLYFVKDCSVHFKRALAERLTVQLYQKDDVVFHVGEAGEFLYLLHQGTVKLQSHLASPATSPLTSGLFGETGHAAKRGRRTSTMRNSRRVSAFGAGKPGGRSVRNSQLPRPGFSPGAASAPDSSAFGGAGRTVTTIASVLRGAIGQYEFFLRDCYSCSAVADSDVVMLELSFETFWQLVTEFGLEEKYTTMCLERATSVAAASAYSDGGASTLAATALSMGTDSAGAVEFLKLQQSGTAFLASSVSANLKSSKLGAMYDSKQHDDDDERAEDGILMPDGVLVQAWNAVQALLLLYVVFTVPYCFAFGVLPNIKYSAELYHLQVSGSHMPVMAVADLAVILIVVVEAVLRLGWLAVKDDEGLVITDISLCRAQYIASGDFACDILAALPLGFCSYLVADSWAAFPYLRLLVVLRLRQAGTVFSALLSTVETLRGRNVDSNLLRVLKFIFFVWYFVHMVACVMCAVGLREQAQDVPSWVEANGFAALPNIQIYLRGYFWAAYTVITVGYGSISISSNLERALAMISMTFGAIICNAGIAAVFGSIISNYDDSHGRARRSHEACLRFCKSNKVDLSVQRRLSVHHLHLSTEMGCNDANDDNMLMPRSLRWEYIHSQVAPALARIAFANDSLAAFGGSLAGKAGTRESAEGKSNQQEQPPLAIGASKCPRAAQLEGMQWSLVRLMEISLHVAGEVVLSPRELCSRGWEGDLLVAQREGCVMLVGHAAALSKRIAAMSAGQVKEPSSGRQSFTSAGAGTAAAAGWDKELLGSLVYDDVLHLPVEAGEALLPEALEGWRHRFASAPLTQHTPEPTAHVVPTPAACAAVVERVLSLTVQCVEWSVQTYMTNQEGPDGEEIVRVCVQSSTKKGTHHHDDDGDGDAIEGGGATPETTNTHDSESGDKNETRAGSILNQHWLELPTGKNVRVDLPSTVDKRNSNQEKSPEFLEEYGTMVKFCLAQGEGQEKSLECVIDLAELSSAPKDDDDDDDAEVEEHTESMEQAALKPSKQPWRVAAPPKKHGASAATVHIAPSDGTDGGSGDESSQISRRGTIAGALKSTFVAPLQRMTMTRTAPLPGQQDSPAAAGENPSDVLDTVAAAPSARPAGGNADADGGVLEKGRRRMSSIFTVVSPSAMMGMLVGDGEGIDEEDSDASNSDSGSDTDSEDDAIVSSTGSSSGSSLTSAESAAEETGSERTVTLLDSNGKASCRVTLLVRVVRTMAVPPIDAAASAAATNLNGAGKPAVTIRPGDVSNVDLHTLMAALAAPTSTGPTQQQPASPRGSGGSHSPRSPRRTAAVGIGSSSDATPGTLHYAVVATSGTSLYRVPSAQLHSLLSFYKLCEKSPSSRQGGLPSGGRRRISVTAISMPGSSSPGGNSGSRNSVSKRTSTSARQSTLRLTSQVGFEPHQLLAKTGSAAGIAKVADSAEFGQSSVDISAARMTLRQHSLAAASPGASGASERRDNHDTARKDQPPEPAAAVVAAAAAAAAAAEGKEQLGGSRAVPPVPLGRLSKQPSSVGEEEENEEEEEEQKQSAVENRNASPHSGGSGPSPGPSTNTTRSNSPVGSPRQQQLGEGDCLDFQLDDLPMYALDTGVLLKEKLHMEPSCSPPGNAGLPVVGQSSSAAAMPRAKVPPSQQLSNAKATTTSTDTVRRFSEVHEAAGLDSLVTKLREKACEALEREN